MLCGIRILAAPSLRHKAYCRGRISALLDHFAISCHLKTCELCFWNGQECLSTNSFHPQLNLDTTMSEPVVRR